MRTAHRSPPPAHPSLFAFARPTVPPPRERGGTKSKEPGVSAWLPHYFRRSRLDRDQKLMSIVERRFSGSFTPSPVWTAGWVSPFQSTDRAPELTPRPTRASATAFARRSDRRWL